MKRYIFLISTGSLEKYVNVHAVNADDIIITNQYALITDCYEEVVSND